MMKLDILAFASHPDDVELSCSGTLGIHQQKGKDIGVVDLTRGELGTRGSAAERDKEAEQSARIMKLKVRENLGLDDGFFTISKENMLAIARMVRRYQPEIVLANAVHDRHPDHGRAAKLVEEGCFYAGLIKIKIEENGSALDPWRPKALYHYIQSEYIDPDFIVDVTDAWDTKMESIKAFKSQFYDPDSSEPETYISKPGFLKFIEARGKMWGQAIGVDYGEGYTVNRKIGVRDLFSLI